MVLNPIRDAKVICMPWSIDPTNYKPKKWSEKDIDIALICSVNSNFKYHENRRDIKKRLQRMQRAYPSLNIVIENKLWNDPGEVQRLRIAFCVLARNCVTPNWEAGRLC